MGNLAIIPARGGSKRIPGKNIKIFLGRPIISYVIEAALASGLFSEVMVSTDDADIARIARSFGAQVPFMRTEENASDVATTASVVTEVLDYYTAQQRSFDTICCIYPTAVFTTKVSLHDSFEAFRKGDFDTLIPVVAYGHPIQRSCSFDGSQLTMNFPEHRETRTQDLGMNFHDSGQFYWAKAQAFASNPVFFTERTGGYIVSELTAQDIDSETDWKLAELKYRLLQETHRNE